MRRRTKDDHFVETKSQNRDPLLLILLTFPPLTQREKNIVCIYNYVNMSNSSSKVLVSVVKTDYFDRMSLGNFLDGVRSG